MPVSIGFLGPRGTFTEQAAALFADRTGLQQSEFIAFRTIADVLLGTDSGQVNIGVVPAENSLEGSVVVTLDYLVHEVDLRIIGEVVLPVRHCLMLVPGASMAAVTTVLSHPQALAQCRHSLAVILPQATQRACESTAEAARMVSEGGNPAVAAIGTDLAASLYGLQVVHTDLQDTEHNATRFLVVGKQAVARSGDDKTSVVFAFATDRAGNLVGALQEFAQRGINMTKLESRPAKRSLGDYIFFADLEGYETDAKVAQALQGLRQKCALVRVLGSYPRDRFGG